MSEVEQILPFTNSVGEGPLWVSKEQALYWVDLNTREAFRYEPATGKSQVFNFGVAVTVLGQRAAGGFVAATHNGFAFWQPQPDLQVQPLEFLADPEADIPANVFNDGAVDRQGRFWAGTLNIVDESRPDGSLYRLDPDLTLHTMETGISISNGPAWSPDNRTMYFTPSGKRQIWAYDFAPETGAISNRRVFTEFDEKDGLPDGHTVDSQGYLWSAFWGSWKVCRFDPDGKLEREIRIPSAKVTCPKFGGPNLDELYVTSAYTGLSEEERAQQPQAGGLFRIQVDVKGLPEPEFSG